MNTSNDTEFLEAFRGVPVSHHYLIRAFLQEDSDEVAAAAIAMNEPEISYHLATIRGALRGGGLEAEPGFEIVPRDVSDYVADLRRMEADQKACRQAQGEPPDRGGVFGYPLEQMRGSAQRAFSMLDDDGRAMVELHFELATDTVMAAIAVAKHPGSAQQRETKRQLDAALDELMDVLKETQPAAHRYVSKYHAIDPERFEAVRDSMAGVGSGKRKAKRKHARRARRQGR